MRKILLVSSEGEMSHDIGGEAGDVLGVRERGFCITPAARYFEFSRIDAGHPRYVRYEKAVLHDIQLCQFK